MNFLLGCVGFTQVTRILLYQRKVKNGTITKAAEDDAIDAIDTAKDIARDTAGAAEDTMN